MNKKITFKTILFILSIVVFLIYSLFIISRRISSIIYFIYNGVKAPVNVSLISLYPNFFICLVIGIIIIFFVIFIIVLNPRLRTFLFNIIFNDVLRKYSVRLFIYIAQQFQGYPDDWGSIFNWAFNNQVVLSRIAKFNTLLILLIFLWELFFNDQILKYSILLFCFLSLFNFVLFLYYLLINILFFVSPEAFNYTLGAQCDIQILTDIVYLVDKDSWQPLIKEIIKRYGPIILRPPSEYY